MSILTESKKWANVKTKICEGLSAKKARMVNTLLENTRGVLLSEAYNSATTAGNIASVNKVILPLIRRVMPSVIANEIMGVQPMQGPVAQISTLRVQYGETIPADGTGVVAGTEALSPDLVAKYYSGNQDINDPDAAETADLELTMGPKVKVQVLKETVTAKSHRLSAEWTVEAQQDAQSQYGLDIEAELFTAVAQEMVIEIDQIMLGKLRKLAGPAKVTYDQAATSGVATSVVDEHASLAVLIQQQSNQIARKTRRGPANWAVVSNDALTVLQSARSSAFAQTTKGTFDAPTNTKLVGTLNNSVKVYADNFATVNTPVMIGYKGNNETDAAAFYCPYIPLQSIGSVIDPNTGALVTTFLTRYGYAELSNSATSLGNAADYLAAINTRNLRFF